MGEALLDLGVIEGFRRKVFKIVDEGLRDSEFLTAGLTIFEPGEASSLHDRPESQEVNFVVRGSGEVMAEDGRRTEFGTHTFMYHTRHLLAVLGASVIDVDTSAGVGPLPVDVTTRSGQENRHRVWLKVPLPKPKAVEGATR